MKKKWILGFILALVLITVAGCSDGSKGEDDTKASEEVLYPISVNGTEIRVGETTVQALLDAGLSVTVSENFESYEVDPETELEANSYYTGASVWVTDSIFALISFVTEDEAVKLGDAVIARLEFQMYGEEDTSVLEKITLNGVPITEITHAKAEEMFPDFTGNEVMWLKKGLDYEYDLNFDMETTLLKSFTVARKYDVDWSSSN